MDKEIELGKYMLGAIQGTLVEIVSENCPNEKFYKMRIPLQEIQISSLSSKSCTDGSGNVWTKCIIP